jgi:hypothetical protein
MQRSTRAGHARVLPCSASLSPFPTRPVEEVDLGRLTHIPGNPDSESVTSLLRDTLPSQAGIYWSGASVTARYNNASVQNSRGLTMLTSE